MNPSPATQLSIPSLLQPCWILTCQNILGSVATTVSPPASMWDGVCVYVWVCVCICMWQCDKRQMSDLNRDSMKRRRGGERASHGQVAWSGWRKGESEIAAQWHMYNWQPMLPLHRVYDIFSVIYFSWPALKTVVGWAVSRRLGWKWQSRA